MLWVGVDVGGTFTDAVVFDDRRSTLSYGKSPSTPGSPTAAVLAVLGSLEVDMASVGRFVHGITIGTNAILERKGAEVWMLTTAGFRDVLDIARTNRTELYDIKAVKPPPLVPRARIVEVAERMMYDGSVRRALDMTDARGAVARLDLSPGAAVAVCFLHSYANPAHEEAVADLVRSSRARPFVCTSAEVLPEFREYERFNTTALNAYLGPLTDRYLSELGTGLADTGYPGEVYIMTSNGGISTAARARRLPVTTVLSGPAGGVAAAVDLGARIGHPDLITCDMGGTSTDVCLIEALEVPLTNEQLIGGFANRTPQTEINAVGAGGGSIAWIDAGDILMVGPRSAGAEPGPACYGQGGREPTVTDANLVLARLKPGSRLAGAIVLDAALARESITGLGATVAALSAEEAAEGIIQIAVARMVSAIKQISVSKGYDPRDFTLVAYGGAGPMHAAFIAEELEIERIVVPRGPGNFAALGSLISDVRQDFVRTRTILPRRAGVAEVESGFRELEAQAAESLAKEGVALGQTAFRRALGMRYLGQSWELAVEVPEPPDGLEVADLEAAFNEVHQRRYGHASDAETEIVTFRLTARAAGRRPEFPPWGEGGSLAEAEVERRPVFFAGRFRDTPVYERDRLAAGTEAPGPLIVAENGSTTVVPPGWRARLLEFGDLLLEYEGL